MLARASAPWCAMWYVYNMAPDRQVHSPAGKSKHRDQHTATLSEVCCQHMFIYRLLRLTDHHHPPARDSGLPSHRLLGLVGMMLPSGGRGREFDSPSSPFLLFLCSSNSLFSSMRNARSHPGNSTPCPWQQHGWKRGARRHRRRPPAGCVYMRRSAPPATDWLSRLGHTCLHL